MIPVVELLRVSTDTQAEGQNLPAQHSVNLHTCSRYDLEVVETVEIVESGAEVARSPQMAYLLDLISSGRAKGVVLAEYSRLFRPDRWSDMVVLQTFADYGANIYLPSGTVDLQSEAGFVQATVYNMAGALERRRIRERMQRGKEEIRRRGGQVNTAVGLPLGMTYSDGAWHYTPDIAKVRKVFELFLVVGEVNLSEVGRLVGLRSSHVKSILRNPIYSGWRVYDKRHDPIAAKQGKRRLIDRAPDEIIRVKLSIEPVVSEEDFARVQKRLTGRLRAMTRRPRVLDPERFLYRGYAFCACGLRLYGLSKIKTDRYYYICKSRCTNRRPDGVTCDNPYMLRDQLEAALDRAISQQLLDPDILAPAIEAYNDSVVGDWRAPDYDAIRASITALERKRARVVEAFVDGAIGAADRDVRLRAIDLELLEARRSLGAVTAAPHVIDQATIREWMLALAEWGMLSRGARRNALDRLKPSFFVHNYTVRGVALPVATDGLHSEIQSASSDHRFRKTVSGIYIPLVA